MVRILVAEDESDIQTLIQRRLHREGYELLFADNGDEALRLAIAERPDLIVLDWMMPGLTGIDVCVALRAHAEISATKVLMLTARAQESDLKVAFDAGIDAYLIKPFGTIELQESVATLLTRV